MLFAQSFIVLAAALFSALARAAPTGPIVEDITMAAANVTETTGTVIPDSYIVVLKDGVTQEKFESHQRWAQALHSNRLARRGDPNLTGVRHGFSFGGLYGYAGAFDADTLDEIRVSDEVDYIEEDKVVVAYEWTKQNNVPSWGLGRLSSKDGKVTDTYTFDSSAGEGVNVYVLDTGVNTEHVDFGGRAIWGTNVADDNNADNQGHGTHVAGTIAGVNYGVAKKANVVAVKVLGDNGSGSTSKVISGIEWTVAHASSRGRSPVKSVVNMSLGGSYSPAINRAVEAASSQGLTFVVAAGNDGKDAASYSPASSPNAITVGATQLGDQRASYSNYGTVVDVFAPGSRIVSTWIGGQSAVYELSGTSMASPHVAGLAAYLIAAEGLEGPQSVTARIKELAQQGIVVDPGLGSPNEFVWNGAA